MVPIANIVKFLARTYLFFTTVACFSSCDHYVTEMVSEGSPTDSIRPIIIRANIKESILEANQMNRPVIADIYGQPVLVYFKHNNDSLLFRNVIDEKEKINRGVAINRLPIRELVNEMPFTVQNNRIYFLASKYGVIFVYDIDPDFSLRPFKEINFAKFLEKNNFFVRFDYSQGLKIIDHYAYVPFGKSSRWRNFTHSKSYLKINIDSPNQKIETVLETLPVYRNGLRKNKDTYLNTLTSPDSFVYGFRTFDRLDLFDRNSIIVKRIYYGNNNNYLPFNKKEADDLSYVRIYETTNETNEAFFTERNNVIVLKRKKKLQMKEPSVYNYIVLDAGQNYRKRYDHEFTRSINPYYSFPFKNGFVVFADNLSEAYYYEIP